LLDNIINPSKTIAEGFTTYVVRTKTGDVFSGLLTSKTADQITLKDPQLKIIRISSADVEKLAPQTISSMPDGLLGDLTPQQAADLLAFLNNAK
jgi:putative heme-binding domain-containing protein